MTQIIHATRAWAEANISGGSGGGLTLSGDWSSSVDYVAGDLVRGSNGFLYLSIYPASSEAAANQNPVSVVTGTYPGATDGTYWVLLSQFIVGPGFFLLGPYSAELDYVPGMVAVGSDGDLYYYGGAPGTGHDPVADVTTSGIGASGTYWARIAEASSGGTAAETTYVDSGRAHITHTNVQDALDDLDSALSSGGGTASGTTFDDTGMHEIAHTNVQDALADLDTAVNGITTGGSVPYIPVDPYADSGAVFGPFLMEDFTTYATTGGGSNFQLNWSPAGIISQHGNDVIYSPPAGGIVLNVPGLWSVEVSVEVINLIAGDVIVLSLPDGSSVSATVPPGQTYVDVSGVATLSVADNSLIETNFFSGERYWNLSIYSAQTGIQIDEMVMDATLLMAIGGGAHAASTLTIPAAITTGTSAAAGGSAGEVTITWTGASALTGSDSWGAFLLFRDFNGNGNSYQEVPTSPTDTTITATGLTTGQSLEVYVYRNDGVSYGIQTLVTTVTVP